MLVAFLSVLSPQVALAQDLQPSAKTIANRLSVLNHKTIAVVDFTDLEGHVSKLGRFLAEEFSVNLLEEAKGFEVIDRTHLKALLQEHQLSTTGLIDPATARKLGKIAGADALVTGTLTPLGDTIRLSLKVIDTETAKMIAATSADIPKTQTLIDLIGSNSATPEAGLSASAGRNSDSVGIPAEITGEQSGFVFGVRKCERSGGLLVCTGSVKNKLERRRTMNLVGGAQPVAIDELGNQYKDDIYRFRFGTSGSTQELETDLPVNFSLFFEEVNAAATRVTVILAGWVQNEGNFKVTLRNIPISKN